MVSVSLQVCHYLINRNSALLRFFFFVGKRIGRQVLIGDVAKKCAEKEEKRVLFRILVRDAEVGSHGHPGMFSKVLSILNHRKLPV